jgi:hypothetical protein
VAFVLLAPLLLFWLFEFLFVFFLRVVVVKHESSFWSMISYFFLNMFSIFLSRSSSIFRLPCAGIIFVLFLVSCGLRWLASTRWRRWHAFPLGQALPVGVTTDRDGGDHLERKLVMNVR